MDVIESHGAKIPVVGFGTMTLKDNLCIELVEAALHLGYRHLDTAQNYGNEREVGEGFRASGCRARMSSSPQKSGSTAWRRAISSARSMKAWSGSSCRGSICS